MEKSLHFFDLDYTLWILDSKLAVIDKDEPQTVIYRISSDEDKFMREFYKKEGLEVSYNGHKWYLTEKILKAIQKVKNIDLDRIGISYREFTDKELLESQIFRTEYLLENLNHLKGIKMEIGVLTARSNKINHTKNLEVLKEKIENKLQTKINKIYFVNDIDNNHKSDLTSIRKAKIVLEYLTGYKIKGNKFVDLKQEKYLEVHFYDDSFKNIEVVNNLQILIENLLVKTELDIKIDILNLLKNNELKFITHQITQNKLQPFITKENKLLNPNYIKLFEEF